MATEHKNRMIPSDRIRKSGQESENIKLSDKLLGFHYFILGLQQDGLNSTVQELFVPSTTKCGLYSMCSQFSIYCGSQSCDTSLVRRLITHKNKYCLGFRFCCSFLEDFHNFRFHYRAYISGVFLLVNLKHCIKSCTMSITKIRKTEVSKGTYTISCTILMRERKLHQTILQDFGFVSALLNELP